MPEPVYVATVTGRGMMHIPAELRRKLGLKAGDKVELRVARRGVVVDRISTLEEGFGEYPGLGGRWARDLLEEKRAELAQEERKIREAEKRPRRGV